MPDATAYRSPTRLARDARSHRATAGIYFALATAGLVSTWYFNFQHIGSAAGSYLGGWFANAASSSAAVDIIAIVGVAAVLYVREGRRLGWPLPATLVFIPLSAAVAVAFARPLFLGLRELALAGHARRAAAARRRDPAQDGAQGGAEDPGRGPGRAAPARLNWAPATRASTNVSQREPAQAGDLPGWPSA